MRKRENFGQKYFLDVRDFYNSDLDKNKEFTMTWHEIAMMVKGDTVIDLKRHFTQYWNYILLSKYLKAKNNHQIKI